MPLTVHTCVSAACDGCGESWDDESVRHYATAAEAHTDLRGNGWLITGQRLLCSTCVVKAECTTTGHQYGPWEQDVANGVSWRQRLCEHCGTSDYDPPREELQNLLHLAWQVNQIGIEPKKEG